MRLATDCRRCIYELGAFDAFAAFVLYYIVRLRKYKYEKNCDMRLTAEKAHIARARARVLRTRGRRFPWKIDRVFADDGGRIFISLTVQTPAGSSTVARASYAIQLIHTYTHKTRVPKCVNGRCRRHSFYFQRWLCYIIVRACESFHIRTCAGVSSLSA
ncbi:hypothetical protein QTP88_017230 [Uroleucon formosanum]